MPQTFLSPESHKHLKKVPIQARSRATVSAILEATAQLLHDTSPEHLTTAQIAERAGVSVGSMYQYFESKESVIIALTTDIVAQLTEAVRRTLDSLSGSDASVAIAPIVDALLETHRQHPERIGFLIEYLASHGSLGPIEEPQRTLEDWLAAYFASHGYASPEVSRIRVRIAVQGVSAVIRATLRYSPEDMEQPYLREELVRFLRRLLPDEEEIAAHQAQNS